MRKMNKQFVECLNQDSLAKSIVRALGPERSYTLMEIVKAVKKEKSVVITILEKLIKNEIVEERLHNKRTYYTLTHAAYQVLEQPLNLPDSVDIRYFKMIDTAVAERKARTCYSHLAGELGVTITKKLMEKQLIVLDENAFLLTEKGMAYFKNMGVDVNSLKKAKVSKACLDWSERKYHLGSPLGKLLTNYLFSQNWIERSGSGRAIIISKRGSKKLKQAF